MRLEDIAKWGSGGTPSRKVEEYFTGNIPWIKTGELKSKYIRKTEEKITDEALSKSNAKIFPRGSVAIAMYGATIGKVSILDIDASTNQACAVAIPNKEILFNEFLYYFFIVNKNKFINLGQGGAQPNISQTMLKTFSINLPPLNEQTRIVEKIEELFSSLDNAKDYLKKTQKQLKTYRQSVLKAAFEGKLVSFDSFGSSPFSEVCEINPSKSELNNSENSMEVTFLPMSAVSENGIIIKKQVKKLKDVKKGFTYFKNGDILLAKITPCFENGKRAIVEDLKNGIGFGSTEFHVLRPKEKVVSKWVYYGISLENFRNKAKSQMTGTAGQKRVPKRVVESYKIKIPTKTTQEKIIKEIESRLSVADKLEETVQESLDKIEYLRQSILKQAFEGKLVPQWPDLPAPQPGKYWVYVIKCNNDSNYIGFTSNLRQRWEQHLSGEGAEWTKKHKPQYIMYWEEFDSKADAIIREDKLKTGYGRKWIKREEKQGRLWRAGEPAEELLKQIKIEKEKMRKERGRK